jgi:hypothetical protein
VVWPKPGKLGTVIVQSLKQNALARLAVFSEPGEGFKVVISFAKSVAAPEK